MAQPGEPRRRFAPVPIETSFQSVRRPNPELTPDPSPPSASPTIPEPQPGRRFHPQLIETSRRTRRACDVGPATRPTDKTDITPYTNHIYVTKPKHRRKHGDSPHDEPDRHMPPTRRETEEEGVKEYLLDLAAKDTARRIQEAALAAFPNSRAREGGVAHFYYRESSGSDNSADDAHARRDQPQPRARRKSSDLGLNWWHRHMQEHAEHLAHDRGERALPPGDQDPLTTTDSDLDDMDLCVPPNPLWTTNQREERGDPFALPGLMRNGLAHAPRSDAPTPMSMDLGAGPDGRDPASHVAPCERLGGREVGPGRPFGVLGLEAEDPTLLLMRQAASPPMLGKDLRFRKCPSPKQTKLETDHPFVEQGGTRERDRDMSGQGGLWNGYCCRSGSNGGCAASADSRCPGMVVTPQAPASPREGFTCDGLSEEPSPAVSPRATLDGSAACSTWTGPGTNGDARGLLQVPLGLDGRLERQRARDEKIAHEFDDDFVTQVYNYLSLGYPAMARSFDEELSKISLVSTEELARDDDRHMAKGHMLEMRLGDTPEQDRCPRWRALKLYIVQWAQSHPDLDSLDPLAWGVRERRGSWAI